MDREKNKDVRDEMMVAALSMAEDAYEATDESPIIAAELARIKDQLGSLEQAIGIVRRAVKKNPENSRLQNLLIRFEVENGDPRKALKVAVEAAKMDPTSWRIQRQIAKLRRQLKDNIATVRGHYEAALRHHKGDVNLVVEYGAYLFMQGLYEDAKKEFESLANLTISSQDRNRSRESWRGPDNSMVVFVGKIVKITGAKGTVLAIPQNFEALFWRSTATSLYREGDEVRFTVAFNAYGASARVLGRGIV
jgi:tetratricopeptide (TPR) repeat protein